MLIYRIDRTKYRESILSGEGAMLHGGRWNYKNTRAIYASCSRSLAMLEILVHIRQVAIIPEDRIIVTIEIPDEGVITIDPASLSNAWNNVPQGPDSNRELFEKEVIQGKKLGMAVPSVVMPHESNYVISPHSKLFEQVKVAHIEPLQWDYRL